MKKSIITIVIIIATVGLMGYILMKNKEENQEKTAIVAKKNAAVSVKVDTVKVEQVSLDFKSNGYFEPLEELKLSAEKPGKVTQILVKEGDFVKVGQTLAIVRSDVININAENANAIYQNAVADYNRFENAYKTGGVTKQQLDQARLAMINAKSNLNQANINVEDTRIKAPISGIINKKFIEVGAVLAGTPPTELFEIVNVTKLKLKVTVNESQVANLKVGSPIKITSNIYPDKEFSGKITFIAPKADASLNFPVEIEITNNVSNELKAGMYGTANFSSQEKPTLKIVPREAFVGSVGSNEVFVVKNGVATLKKVTAGRIIGEKVEILDGLNEGELVVVTGQINLQDGSVIEIIK